MAKSKIKTVVKSHYTGNKNISEAFYHVLKNQIILNINKNSLIDNDRYAILNESNLLSEREGLC